MSAGWWGAIRNMGLAGALVSVAACGSLGAGDDAVSLTYPGGGYQLGGQTGSLVPGCGVAPLSAAGSSVPEGDALAILYAGDCPEAAVAARLALTGQGATGVMLELVPLEGSAVFLVRAKQSLASGDYQLGLGTGSTSELEVGDAAPAVPRQLGPLELLPSDAECVDVLRFALTLDEAALAYAPLSRFDVSIDGGPGQRWVDYGALPIESSAEGSRGVLELPRCTSTGCLLGGAHRLQLRASVAGEGLAPEPLDLAFDVQCPLPAGDDSSDTGAGCSLSRSTAPRGPVGAVAGCLAVLSWFVLRRRARRA